MKLTQFLFLCAIIFISSCTKEMDKTIIEEDEVVTPVATNVETYLLIKVKGLSNQGIVATALINDVTYSANAEGLFVIPSILLDKKGEVIFIEADGFISSAHSVIPTLGTKTYLNVSLFPEGQKGSFNGFDGGTIQNGNSEFIIPPQSVVDINGNAYTEDVIVTKKTIQSALYATLTGTFDHNFFTNGDGKNYSLQNFGGENIILKTESGDRLYIKEGAQIQASIEVRPIEGNTIPDQFDVMRFNIATQTWEIVGNAEFDGTYHVAEISNLGHLRWTKRVETQLAKVQIVSNFGPIPSVPILVYSGETNPLSVGYSNNEGSVLVYLPIDKTVFLNALTLCQPFLVSKESETLSQNDDYLILADYTEFEDASKIEGVIVDCNNNPVSEGILEIQSQFYTNYIHADETGVFSSAYIGCQDATASARLYDPNTDMYSDEFEIEISPGTVSNIGAITACQ